MAIKRITTNLIKDSDIATVDIANNAITAAKITDGNITTAKLADLSVTAGKLAGTLDLTGKTITVATATTGDNDTSPASTAFVQQEIAALVDSSPDSLNTLNELAAALGDDANFSTTVTNSIATKAPLATPQFTNRVGIGVAAHATAALNITTTNQHIRLNNGSELGIIHVLSTGELELWGHGDGESINFRTGSGTGTVAMNVVGTNVGIGESNPDAPLHITSNTPIISFDESDASQEYRIGSFGGTFALYDSTDSAYRLAVDGDGNVGIGTTSPQDTLHVVTDSATTNAVVDVARIEATSSGTPAVGFGPVIEFRGERAAASSDSLGRVGFVSDVMTSTRVDGAFVVQTAIDGSFSERMRITSGGTLLLGQTTANANAAVFELTGKNSTQGTIRITPDSNKGSEVSHIHYGSTGDWYIRSASTSGKVIINDAGGNVGIGDTSPQDYLEINGSGRGLGGLTISNDTHNHAALSFARSSTATARIFISEPAATHTSQFNFQTSDASGGGANLVTAMVIDENQNVGIGTTSPSSTLTVGGTIESLNDDAYGSNEGGQITLRSPSNTTTSKRYSFDTFNVSNASVLRLISEDDSDAANGIVRMALDTKGTFLFTNGTSSFAHNTYAHAAVFSRNSTPQGTVVIEDSDVSSGIGNTVLNLFLRDQDPATSATFIDFRDGGGRVASITHADDGGSVSYNTTSDYRLKENIDYDWDALTLVTQLKPAKFNFIRKPDKTVQGFLAHEVSEIVPNSVTGNKDHIEPIGTITDSDGNTVHEGVYEHFCKTDEGQTWTQTGTEAIYQQLDQSKLVPLLTKAIQELSTKLEAAEARITELEG